MQAAPWTLAAEVWKRITAQSSRPRSLAFEVPAHPRGLGTKGRGLTAGELDHVREIAAAALLAAWVCLAPLAPQQAKREAVIAVDPVHAPVELGSRQRAAEQAARWGFGS